MANLNTRLHASERLDNLSLSGKPLKKTLKSLKLINRIFGNHKQLSRAIQDYCKKNEDLKVFHIVDLGCGGGDCIQYLAKKLAQKEISIIFTGIDGNPNSIAYAKKNNIHNQNVNYKVDNILDSNFVVPDCDILISSHFMYHFKDEELLSFLRKIQGGNVKHVIFSELYRNKVAYYLFKFVRHLLPMSEIAKKDGLIAIKRAFSIEEFKKVIRAFGIKKFKIRKKPFFRMIVKLDFK